MRGAASLFRTFEPMMMDASLDLILWSPGPTELIIVAVVILLLFGGRKIPELMRGLGKGVKEFKDASNDENQGGEQQGDGEGSKETPGRKDR